MELWNYGNFLTWFTLIFTATVAVLFKQKRRRSRHDVAGKQLPPGPSPFPIIGNIFDLGKNAHRDLYELRFKYGDVLWLKLGFTNTMVIQTAKAAEELFKKHDAVFCDRKVPQSFTAQNYSTAALALGRYDSNWRFHRKFVTLELMTSKRMSETTNLRQKCVDNMIKYIEEDVEAAIHRRESGELVIAHYVFVMTFNLIGNLIFSRDLLNSQSEAGPEFFEAMNKAMKWSGKPNLADFFPFLQRLDPQRVKRNMEIHLGKTIDVVKRFMEERVEEKKLEEKREIKDFLDALLDFKGVDKEDPDEISTHSMLIIILELFFGGTETTSSTLEWAMAELLRRPESMRRLREELDEVVGASNKIEESHLDELPYLHAVLKETMRLHPALPLLVPRNTIEDTTFMGYFIPKETQVYVNVWAIGRDPQVWKDPFSFQPERFLGCDIDYKGQNFNLLPFGSGRRICAGIPLADRVVHLVLASLVHNFDWELAADPRESAIDMSERLGITVRKLLPLKAIPKRRIIGQH